MKFINNNIWFFWICITLASCQGVKVPYAYNFRMKDIQNNPFGCWTIISIRDARYVGVDNMEISGELIAIENNLLYLLSENRKVDTIRTGNINRVQLITHKNLTSNYLLTTGLLLIPNLLGVIVHPDYAGEFLLLSIPVTIFGLGTALVEESGDGNILIYPQIPLSDFKKFARFPAGLPPDLDLNNLLLKE